MRLRCLKQHPGMRAAAGRGCAACLLPYHQEQAETAALMVPPRPLAAHRRCHPLSQTLRPPVWRLLPGGPLLSWAARGSSDSAPAGLRSNAAVGNPPGDQGVRRKLAWRQHAWLAILLQRPAAAAPAPRCVVLRPVQCHARTVGESLTRQKACQRVVTVCEDAGGGRRLLGWRGALKRPSPCHASLHASARAWRSGESGGDWNHQFAEHGPSRVQTQPSHHARPCRGASPLAPRIKAHAGDPLVAGSTQVLYTAVRVTC